MDALSANATRNWTQSRAVHASGRPGSSDLVMQDDHVARKRGRRHPVLAGEVGEARAADPPRSSLSMSAPAINTASRCSSAVPPPRAE